MSKTLLSKQYIIGSKSLYMVDVVFLYLSENKLNLTERNLISYLKLVLCTKITGVNVIQT